MAKFTKLNIGDAVASSGSRVWKKLSAVVEDELQGTWVIKDVPTIPQTEGFCTWQVNFYSYNNPFTSFRLVNDPLLFDTAIIYNLYNEVYDWTDTNGGVWTNNAYKTIVITSKLSEVTNGSTLLEWLNANATKLPSPKESIVGTWVFNDYVDTHTPSTFTIDFRCRNNRYTSINIYFEGDYSYMAYNSTMVYKFNEEMGGPETWNIASAKTIVITTETDDEAFITWLKANATKQ